MSECVSFELNEEQKLRLQLAQRNCELNTALRCLVESDIRVCASPSARAGLQERLMHLDLESQRLTREFFEVGEQIKAENGWPREVEWDASTLVFSVGTKGLWAADGGWIQ
ncbi:MAG TPA: hypothetical protein VKV39_02400 [Candidatus Sulfotelmatobacter sp.]|nr:hypothetical protein [Candidatus Sulfotelmatobacter sp.]